MKELFADSQCGRMFGGLRLMLQFRVTTNMIHDT
jgi:hypothetical protein